MGKRKPQRTTPPVLTRLLVCDGRGRPLPNEAAFETDDGGTVQIEDTVHAQMIARMLETWPEMLAALKLVVGIDLPDGKGGYAVMIPADELRVCNAAIRLAETGERS